MTSTSFSHTDAPAATSPILPSASQRVVVAMSGGVDSSVVAALCAEAGCETIGVTLRLYDDGASARRAGACCAGADIADARRVADRLGIAHYVLDYADAFRTAVVDDFADTYLRGATPVPCVRCNQTVKFRDLLSVARELGADCMATGHYVRRSDDPAGAALHRGIDPAKDQSYFLYATTQAQLNFLRFPLGGLTKAAVRDHAHRFGLGVAAKPDSQDICFVPGGDYAAVVRSLRPEADAPGEIVDLAGRTLGRHRGIIGFTVGQRRGIEVGGQSEPLYVVRIEPDARRVVVGPRTALAVTSVDLDDCNWLADPTGRDLTVKVRSMAKPARALVVAQREIHFAEPEFGVSPGQAAVVYDGDRVLGGGVIGSTRAEPAGSSLT